MKLIERIVRTKTIYSSTRSPSDLSNNPEIKASIEQANQEAQEALKIIH